MTVSLTSVEGGPEVAETTLYHMLTALKRAIREREPNETHNWLLDVNFIIPGGLPPFYVPV